MVRSRSRASRWLAKWILRGLLVAVDVSLKVLTEGGELLVCVLEDALPRQLRDAIQTNELVVLTELRIVYPELLQLLR